jgi:hypothetical protein
MYKAHAAKIFFKEIVRSLLFPQQLFQMMALNREFFFTICPSILAPD